MVGWFATRDVHQGGQDVGVLDDGIGPLVGWSLARPARDQCRVQSQVPVGPLATWELGSLLGGEEHHGVVRLSGLFKGLKDLADLSIHVGDLGQVAAEGIARDRGVGDVGRKLQLVFGILGRISHDPGHMGFHQGDDEAEGFLPLLHELFGRSDVMVLGGGADAVGIEAAHGLEGKGLSGFTWVFPASPTRYPSFLR